MISVKLKLNENRMRKDGTYALVFQIIYQRQKKLVYTPYKLRAENFNSLEGKVVCDEQYLSSPKETKKMNQNIKKQYKEICACINELEQENKQFTVYDIVARIRDDTKGVDLLDFFDECIKQKQDFGKDGTAQAYKSTQASLSAFLDKKDINISKVNQRFVEDYKSHLIKREVVDNTIKYYMRNFRAVYNIAVRQRKCLKNNFPFAGFRTAPSKTVKRALNAAQIRQLYYLQLPEDSSREKYKDLFLFSFFAQGMAFVDIVMLKKECICNGIISYNRYKSNQRVKVKVTEQMQLFLNKYRNDSDYVFGIINDISLKTVYQQYRIALAESNRCLKKIGDMLGFEAPLTTYVARHTWAMEAKNSGASLFVISEGLGHRSEKTTRIYLKELDINVLDTVNRKVSSVIFVN